jgi:adenylate kinase family enzyme
MLMIFFGPSCSGKSTVAELIHKETGVAVWAGKDYLQLANNEAEAGKIFDSCLRKAAEKKTFSHHSIIYVVPSLKSLNAAISRSPDVLKVKFFADIQVLKKRFFKRLQGQGDPPIDAMLQRQLKDIQNETGDMQFDTALMSPQDIANEISSRMLIGKQPFK